MQLQRAPIFDVPPLLGKGKIYTLGIVVVPGVLDRVVRFSEGCLRRAHRAFLEDLASAQQAAVNFVWISLE